MGENQGFKDIKGYEGKYAVTSCGKVWSYRSKKYLVPWDSGTGYKIVDLCKDGETKHYYVHRLVLETYNPVENMNELQCNPIDENKSHNYLSNLNWMTHKENNNWGTRTERAKATRAANKKEYMELMKIIKEIKKMNNKYMIVCNDNGNFYIYDTQEKKVLESRHTTKAAFEKLLKKMIEEDKELQAKQMVKDIDALRRQEESRCGFGVA